MAALLKQNFNLYTATRTWDQKSRCDIQEVITELNMQFRPLYHGTFWQSGTWQKVSDKHWLAFMCQLEDNNESEKLQTLEMLFKYLFGEMPEFKKEVPQPVKEETTSIPWSQRTKNYKNKVKARIALLKYLVHSQGYALNDCQKMKLIDLHQYFGQEDYTIQPNVLAYIQTLDLMDEDYLFYDVKRGTKDKFLSLSTLQKILVQKVKS